MYCYIHFLTLYVADVIEYITRHGKYTPAPTSHPARYSTYIDTPQPTQANHAPTTHVDIFA